MLHHERGMSLVSFLFVPQLCSLRVPALWGHWDRGQWDLALQRWPCKAGQEASLLLWQGKDIYYVKQSVQCSGLCSVALGSSKLSREGWICARDYTGGSEIHQNQENNPILAKKSQCSASAMLGKVQETKARKGKTQK